jgi:CubicO group peptidase (beta-lactamase class C family)
LEQKIPRLLEQNKVPGLSMAIIKNAKIAWLGTFGVRDRTSGAPVEPSTVFEAASMSKPPFAYVVMKLREKGTLDLDVPLRKYTSERFLNDDSRLSLITARHVLSHTGGFQNWRSASEPIRIQFTPGEKWSYSGEGYYYLQTVVTHLTGHTDRQNCSRYEAGMEVCATDFGQYMEANLLKPFGMNSSGYVWTEAIGKQFARPHDREGRALATPKPRATEVARYGAAGGLLTTATDYAKFLIEVMQSKKSDAFRLSEASLREMTRPQIQVSEGDGYVVFWGLGWRIVRTAAREFIGHGGENPGFQSTSEICLKNRSGFVILTNGDNGARLLEKLAPEVSRHVHAQS